MDREFDLSEFTKRVRSADFTEGAVKFVSRLTKQSLQRWYTDLPEDWFDNPAPYPDGTSRRGSKRTFMFPLGNSWEDEVEAAGFVLSFKKGRADGSNWGLRLQQYGSAGLPGGVIKPTRKRALTIPVTQEAHGRTVREFQAATGFNLFVVGREDGEKLGTLAWEDEGGKLHAAYVLRKSARIPSLKQRRGHDALPSNEELGEWAARAFVKFFKNLF